jgi:acetolactate synthase-1/2/3 large subunit
MNASDAVASVLQKEGIEYLVCYPRQPVIESCSKLGIQPIVCRQERVGVGIADGISRSTSGKKIGVFAMQGAAGIENTFPGVAQVYGDNVPLLLIAGTPLGRSYTQPHFRALDNFGKITKWQADLDKPDAVSERMRRAFHNLRSGKPGPVMLEISDEVSNGNLTGELDYTPVKRMRSAPDPVDVRTVAELLLKASRPVLHVGQGVMYADATNELVQLAELLQVPVMTTNTGKSAFPEHHPLALGAAAKTAPKTVYHFLRNADLIVGVGASFAINPWTPKIPPGKKIVHITNDPSDINKETANVAAILGDAKLTIQALIDEIGARKSKGNGVAEEIRAVKEEWLKEWMPELTSNENPVNQYRVIWEIMNAVDRANTIVTHEAGSPRDQLVPFWESRSPRGYLGWGKSTQLGHGLGLIMGAKLANPDKLCINFMGDASIGMVGMDIETAARSKIGILTIVFNNGVMAGEQSIMKVAIEKYGASQLGGNYSEVAKALGAWSKRVHSAEEFLPVFRQAVEATQSGTPALIEVVAKQNYKISSY